MFHVWILLSGLANLFGKGLTATTGGDLVRELSSGSLLQGRQFTGENGVTAYGYLGIPYGEPPTEDNRYRAPIARSKWNGVLDASDYRVSCLYDSAIADRMKENKFMSEDCLHLNVFSSATCIASGGCPVMVYLHDGSYNYGSPIVIPAQEVIDKWASQHIVTVSLNYRLGSFGFLNTGVMTSAVKNAGLLDQIEALKWVQREIGVFGGDKGKVTLLGKGTGGVNVDQLSISPATGGLFSKIAIIGGAAGVMPYINEETNVRATRKLAEVVGCASKKNRPNVTEDGSVMEDVVKCLRSRNAKILLSAQRTIEEKNRMNGFYSPVGDGDQRGSIIPKSIGGLVRERRGCKMLIGSEKGEMKWMKNYWNHKDIALKALCTIAIKYLKLNSSRNLIGACQKEYSEAPKDRSIFEDITVYLPIYESAYANTNNGGVTYLFEYISNEKDIKNMDIPKASLKKTDKVDETAISEAIVRFIKEGDPSGESLKWEPFAVERGNYVAVLPSSAAANLDEYHRDAVTFWEEKAVGISAGEKPSDVEDYSWEESAEEEMTTTMSPFEPSEWNTTWSSEEIGNLIENLVEEMINDTVRYENISKTAKKEWIEEMRNISGRLRFALERYEDVVRQERIDELKRWIWEHRCGGEDCSKTTTEKPTPTHLPHIFTLPPTLIPSRHNKTHWWFPHDEPTKGPWVIIHGDRTPDNETHIDVRIPPGAYEYMEEISKIIDKVLQHLQFASGSSSDSGLENSLDTVARQSLVQSVLPVIVPSENATEPTVPVVTVYERYWSNAWFWIIHIAIVALLVALVIAVVALCRQRKKRIDYERLA